MKKFIITVIFGLATLFSCGPTKHISNSDYTYFLTETVEPQVVVDSLLGEFTSDFRVWNKMETIGIRYDSTLISSFVNWIEDTDSTAINIAVITYGNTDTCTIKFKPIKLR